MPELASREHLRAIVPVVREALSGSATRLEDLSAIAVTVGPGLVGSLLVGPHLRQIPQLRALHSPDRGQSHRRPHSRRRPGGQTRREPRCNIPPLPWWSAAATPTCSRSARASTIACSARPATMPPAKLSTRWPNCSATGYPGGPVIDRLAPHGDPAAVRFTFAKMKGNALDFSFSGFKTAVLRWVEAHDMADEIAARRALLREIPGPAIEQWLAATPQRTLDLLASFQHAVISRIADPRRRLCRGNRRARHSSSPAEWPAIRDCAPPPTPPACLTPCTFPSSGLSTDNAAMIAAAAFPKLYRREFASLDISRPGQSHAGLIYTAASNLAISAVRSAMRSVRMLSFAAWAPSPTRPARPVSARPAPP